MQYQCVSCNDIITVGTLNSFGCHLTAKGWHCGNCEFTYSGRKFGPVDVLAQIKEQFQRTVSHFETKGGQQVTPSGDFLHVGHSAMLNMKKWIKRIDDCVKDWT